MVFGGLVGLMFGIKMGCKIGKKVVIYGGFVLVVGFVYKVYQGYQVNKQNVLCLSYLQDQLILLEVLCGIVFDLVQQLGGENQFVVNFFIVMIFVVKVDGYIDWEEQDWIFEKIDEVGLDSEVKVFLMDELCFLFDFDKVVVSVSCLEMVVEIYVVLCLVIDLDYLVEKVYLQMLVVCLGLEDGLVQEIELVVCEVELVG